MKRIITISAAIAAMHFATMYFTTASTVSHNLERNLPFFGKPSADTTITQLVSHTSAVLRQPLGFFLSLRSANAEPKEETLTEQILYWLFSALNSVLWGGVIYFVWYGFRNGVHKQQTV